MNTYDLILTEIDGRTFFPFRFNAVLSILNEVQLEECNIQLVNLPRFVTTVDR